MEAQLASLNSVIFALTSRIAALAAVIEEDPENEGAKALWAEANRALVDTQEEVLSIVGWGN